MGDSLTLHTVAPPTAPEAYQGGTYEQIVGVEHAGSQQWLPDADKDQAQARSFDVPDGMAANTLQYFQEYYIDNPDAFRNCHIGAAAMAGAGKLEWVDALVLANEVMERGRSIEADELAVGAHGVIGVLHEEVGPIAAHSVVGLAPGLGIQTDSIGGDFSLVSHGHNLARYQQDEDWTQDAVVYAHH